MRSIKQLSDKIRQPVSKPMKDAIENSVDLLDDYKVIAAMYNIPFELLETPPPLNFNQ